MASSPKRTRFDASALSPSDTASTPMATARESLKMSVESLQPEIATILLRLGTDFLVSSHKKYIKSQQVKKIEDDEEFIPKSARVKFELKCSKLVEQDEEHISLAADTAIIVQTFQQDLRAKILSTSKLEVTALQKAVVEKFATHLCMTVKACFACESTTVTVNTDKFINTLLHVYEAQPLTHCGTDANAFRAIYQRVHTTEALPPPYVTSLPTTSDIEREDGSVQRVTTLPPAWLLSQLPNIWRTIETTFITPWSVYLDVTKRNNVALELKKLNEEFFNNKITDDTAMLIDSEPPADPQVLNDLITAKVSAATKKMTNEISVLKKALSKNSKRDQSGADKKKSGRRGKAAAKVNDTSNENRKNKNKTRRTNTASSKSSTNNNRNSNQQNHRSNSRTTRN